MTTVGMALAVAMVAAVALAPPSFAVETGSEGDPFASNGTRTNKASIWLYRAGLASFRCSGSVIDARKILTATHCFRDRRDGDRFVVRTGSLDSTRGREHDIVRTDTRYDLAVVDITGEADVPADRYMKAQRADQSGPKLKDIYVAFGWGKTCEFCDPSKMLKNANVFLNDTEARDEYGGPAFRARGRGGRLWPGDSGGPVTVRVNDREVLVGVNSTVEKLGAANSNHSLVSGDNLKWLAERGLKFHERADSQQGAGPDIRIGSLGSSSVEGHKSPDGSGFRGWLYAAITGAAAIVIGGVLLLKRSPENIEFVGSRKNGSMADPDHDGVGGDVIDQVARRAACSIPKYRPNVVLLMAGGNDVLQNKVDGAVDRLGKLVDQILRDAPETTVLVAGVQPLQEDEAAKAGAATFNAQLPAMVEDRQNAGKHVVLVDLGALTAADIGPDMIHMTDAGYKKTAEAFHIALGQAERAGWVNHPVTPGKVPAGCDAVLGGGGNNGGGTSEAAYDDDSRWAHRGLIAQDHEAENSYWFADIDGSRRAARMLVRPSGEVVAWRNNGWENGKVRWAQFSTVLSGGKPGGGDQVRFGDIDGDGRDDCLIVNRDGGITAYTADGSASCKTERKGIGVRKRTIAPDTKIRFADLNGDRLDDYILIHKDGKYEAMINGGRQPGSSSWRWARMANGATWGKGDVPAGGSLHFADVNGDEFADLLKVSPSGAVTAWPNRGSSNIYTTGPQWGNQIEIAKGFPESAGKAIHFADVDGDSRADYLRSGNKGLTRGWLNRANLAKAGDIADTSGGGGAFFDKEQQAGEDEAYDDDSRWAHRGLITQDHEAGNGYWFADVNGDKRADRVMVRPSGEVVVWRHDGWDNGKVKWAQVSTLLDRCPNAPSGTTCRDLDNAVDRIAFGDVDADGRDDCLIVDREGGMKAYTARDGVPCKREWPGIGVSQPLRDAKNMPNITIAPDTKIRFADLNADRRDDYILIHKDGKYQVWFNIGVRRGESFPDKPWRWTAMANGATWGKGDVPEGGSLHFADVNDDSFADLLKVSPTGAVTAWPNPARVIDGNGIQWGSQIEIAKGFPESGGKAFHFADIDGDGRADYLRGGNKGQTRAWLDRANLPRDPNAKW